MVILTEINDGKRRKTLAIFNQNKYQGYIVYNINIMESATPVKGEFRLVGKNRLGDIVLDYQDNNMIVGGAKRAICLLLSDSSADNKVINQIGFGRSNTTPTPADTSLSDAYVKQIDSYLYPETNKVSFRWQLGYDEANGINIVEFGLLCADNTLFAREVS